MRFDADQWHVRRVNAATAESYVKRWHYSHSPASATEYWFGSYAPDLACVFSIGHTANLSGVAAKYGLTAWRGNFEVTRVCAHPDAPRNTVSRTWRGVAAELRARHIDWVFSYADTGQNHHGGIYQAIGAVYVGVGKPVAGFVLDGTPIHPRQVVHLFGTRSPWAVELAAGRGQHLEVVDGLITPKHTYILLTGDRKTRAAIRRALQPFARPYPKRPAAAT